ncbi:SpoIIE family protein phosphatase [Anoxybacterium hadale]|uniref:SpoIIE family protein phosphatase n=1 Tax=Anoxybacterium hadale TaxID=3408580 RepID=A0ACD1AEE6_9FIRM|nr:SpoIIE family protein phosphatase [Clostridiales bacterium]
MSLSEKPLLMRELIEKMDYMVRVMDEDHNVIYMNKKMREEFGHTLGEICYKLLERDDKCEHCVTHETSLTGEPDTKNVPIKGRFYNIISSPAQTDNDEKYSIEVFHDITDQKKTEDELLKHYEKLKADIEFAKHVQIRALPADGKYWSSLEIQSIYCPSEDLGGDIYDVIQMNEAESLLYIADVSGHGITSSLLTISLRQVVRGWASGNPANIKEVSELLLKNYIALGIDKEQYLTILFCLYNKEKRKITFLNAGHNCMPVLISKSGKVKEIDISGLPICALIGESGYETVTIPVHEGDRIVLYTDGITEAFNEARVPFDSSAVLKTLSEHADLDGKALAETVINAVNAYTNVPAVDDMAILVAKML